MGRWSDGLGTKLFESTGPPRPWLRRSRDPEAWAVSQRADSETSSAAPQAWAARACLRLCSRGPHLLQVHSAPRGHGHSLRPSVFTQGLSPSPGPGPGPAFAQQVSYSCPDAAALPETTRDTVPSNTRHSPAPRLARAPRLAPGRMGFRLHSLAPGPFPRPEGQQCGVFSPFPASASLTRNLVIALCPSG